MNLSTAFSFIAHKPVRRNFVDPSPRPHLQDGWKGREAGQGGGQNGV